MPFTNVLANCVPGNCYPLKEEALKILCKKGSTGFFPESSRVYGMLVNLKKKGVWHHSMGYGGVNAKVSVALQFPKIHVAFY